MARCPSSCAQTGRQPGRHEQQAGRRAGRPSDAGSIHERLIAVRQQRYLPVVSVNHHGLGRILAPDDTENAATGPGPRPPRAGHRHAIRRRCRTIAGFLAGPVPMPCPPEPSRSTRKDNLVKVQRDPGIRRKSWLGQGEAGVCVVARSSPRAGAAGLDGQLRVTIIGTLLGVGVRGVGVGVRGTSHSFHGSDSQSDRDLEKCISDLQVCRAAYRIRTDDLRITRGKALAPMA